MSEKNRAKHNVPRRHGDRNVQTRYSGKHQDELQDELQDEHCGVCGHDGTCQEGIREAGGITIIPEVKVTIKIGELHLHGDEHMETFNFHNGCMATVLHGAGDTEMEVEGETEYEHDERDERDEEDEHDEE